MFWGGIACARCAAIAAPPRKRQAPSSGPRQTYGVGACHPKATIACMTIWPLEKTLREKNTPNLPHTEKSVFIMVAGVLRGWTAWSKSVARNKHSIHPDCLPTVRDKSGVGCSPVACLLRFAATRKCGANHLPKSNTGAQPNCLLTERLVPTQKCCARLLTQTTLGCSTIARSPLGPNGRSCHVPFLGLLPIFSFER